MARARSKRSAASSQRSSSSRPSPSSKSARAAAVRAASRSASGRARAAEGASGHVAATVPARRKGPKSRARGVAVDLFEGYHDDVPKSGSVIGGKYRLRRCVGDGAMGSVWSAVHETLGRPVAVKFIHNRGQANPEVTTARFLQEARAAAAVQHRFVVDIFDFGKTEQGDPYMVMELLQGESLADRITRGPPLPIKHFVRMMTQALSGLDAVHKAGIVHRDLKPENIFIIHDADGGFPKLLDFGISRVDESVAGGRASRLTTEGILLGTPWYMSPEQVRGRDVDHRTDIYSMGVIMYEAITGLPPFDAEAVGDLLVKIATVPETPVVALRPDLPASLSDVIAKAMAKESEDRYDSAHSMRLALLAVEKDLPEAFTVVIEREDSEPPVPLASDELMAAASTGSGSREALPVVPTSRPSVETIAAESAGVELDGDLTVPLRRSGTPWVLALVILLGIGGAAAYAIRDSRAGPSGSAETTVVAAPEPERPPEGELLPAEAGLLPAEAEVDSTPLLDAGAADTVPEADTEEATAQADSAEAGPAEPTAAHKRPNRPGWPRRRTQRERAATAGMAGRSTPEAFRDPGF